MSRGSRTSNIHLLLPWWLFHAIQYSSLNKMNVCSMACKQRNFHVHRTVDYISITQTRFKQIQSNYAYLAFIKLLQLKPYLTITLSDYLTHNILEHIVKEAESLLSVYVFSLLLILIITTATFFLTSTK
jgi:hypothetical protein